MLWPYVHTGCGMGGRLSFGAYVRYEYDHATSFFVSKDVK